MEIRLQQRPASQFLADHLRSAPQRDESSGSVTVTSFLRQQSTWCRRVVGDYALDGQVKETLLNLAREYEERLEAIEQNASAPEVGSIFELAAAD